MEPSTARRLQWQEAASAAALIALFVFLAVRHAQSSSATHDESWHLIAGYTYLSWNDYRMSPDHPPLLRKWAAWPLTWMRIWPTPADLAAETEPMTLSAMKRAWALRLAVPEGTFGLDHYFLYGIRDDALRRHGVDHPWLVPTTAKLESSDFFNDADRMLLAGRLAILALSLVLALLVFCWGRELFGAAGGLAALALLCLDPNFIAHSSLVTMDVGLATFCFGAVYFFWRCCRELSAGNFVLAALFFGAANATKPSAVLLAPILVLLTAVRVASTGPWRAPAGWPLDGGRRMGRLGTSAAILVGVAGVAYGVLWAAYGFRYNAAADPAQAARNESALLATMPEPSRPPFRWRHPGHLPIEDAVRRAAAVRHLRRQWPAEAGAFHVSEAKIREAAAAAPLPWSGRLVLFCQQHRLLPEAYLFGMSGFTAPLQRSSFLRGEHSPDGFRSYFLWCFLLKTPLVTLLATALGGLVAWRRRLGWLNLAFLLVPVTVYLAVSVVSRINIGHRHLLPIYPFLFVLAGSVALVWREWQPCVRRWAAAGALTVLAVSATVVFAPPWRPALVYPNYLAYFNELAGGPRGGSEWLVDSNLDWGQGLKQLKRWLEARRVTEPINLCYFGTSSPRYYGIRHVNLPGTYDFAPGVDFSQAVLPGWVVVSATNLRGAYFSEEGRVRWREFLANATLVDTVGYSLFIYRKEAP